MKNGKFSTKYYVYFYRSPVSSWTRNKGATVNEVHFQSFIDANDKERHRVQKTVAIGQGPTLFAVGAGSCFPLSLSFSLSSNHFSFRDNMIYTEILSKRTVK